MCNILVLISGYVVPAGSYTANEAYKVSDGKGGEVLVRVNKKGLPYVEGDPNCGYTEEEYEQSKAEKALRGEKMEEGSKENSLGGQRRGSNTTSSSNRSWASVASGNQKADIKMRFYPTSQKEKEVVLPPRENVGKWSATLVGYFFDKKLNFNYVRKWSFLFMEEQGLERGDTYR